MSDDSIIQEQESEIRYLRHLLDVNGIAYDYQLYKESLAADDGIEFPELSREHAIAFYGMFRGRKDVFAQRSAKKGYHTKCNNFWKYGVCPKKVGEKVKCGECPNHDYTKLTVKTILEHLKGEKEDCTDVIGLYPLFPDGTCWFLVFDFDNHGDEEIEPSKDWQQEVDALRRICELNGIDALVERSRSGRGAHVWVFFREAIQASKVRRFGEALIMKGAEKQGIGHFVYPRFTRLVDVEGDGDRHISDYFDLAVKSEMRNLQIVTDAIDCVKKGRTPLVMTKYREHAQALYQALLGAADHVFLLQGGNSLKARAELREKMLAVGREETMIVVAIGQYIGEGFNYPRLDTLLLAMPISFEGNVEQYAGRLNRDYEGKKDVIIFDYIDQHIPKLERMYHKRLRTYKKIGFEVCSEVADNQVVTNSIFDGGNYLEVYEKDMMAASSQIAISSPSLSNRKITRLLVLTNDRGISIVVFTSDPEAYPEDGREHHRELIQRLQTSGVRVVLQQHCYERYAVIDNSLVWYGSMNLLSNEKEDDNLMRLVSPAIAEELLERSTQS